MVAVEVEQRQWEYGSTGYSLGDLDEMPRHQREEVLAHTLATLKDVMADVLRNMAECESYLRDSMLGRGATIADAGEWEVKLKPTRTYTYDAEHLSCLQAFVEPEQYEQAVATVTTTKVSKQVLNQLRKRGGDVADIIDRATTERITGYSVEVSRRKRA